MIKDMISVRNPKSQAAEAYRTLRTNIQFSSLDEEVKTIVVTSTQPGEGKSTTMINLAITMAQSGKKVIFVDCDLRKPTSHKKLGLSNTYGLTSILAQEKTLEECLDSTSIPNFFIITSGPIPPNPAELLGSKRMKALLKELGEHFDIVLIDAPPVLAVTDAQILAATCDGVVFVASYGISDKVAIVRAKELIDKVGGKMLGVVLNKVPSEGKGYYGNYSYNYSYK